MSRIFLSHSSKNNAEALALREWLASQGWNDVFLDIDPVRGLVAADRWQKALNNAIGRCRAVIFCLSPEWRASEHCISEFDLAGHVGAERVTKAMRVGPGQLVVPTAAEQAAQPGHRHRLAAARPL